MQQLNAKTIGLSEPLFILFFVFKQRCVSDIASSAVRSEADLRAVLSIPLHFQQNSRQTVMRSAEEAGFEVLQVISEPSAAVLAYGVGLSNLDEEQYAITYIKFLP
jgi:actin-like ATPase involved in cell morphogenesis